MLQTCKEETSFLHFYEYCTCEFIYTVVSMVHQFSGYLFLTVICKTIAYRFVLKYLVVYSNIVPFGFYYTKHYKVNKIKYIVVFSLEHSHHFENYGIKSCISVIGWNTIFLKAWMERLTSTFCNIYLCSTVLKNPFHNEHCCCFDHCCCYAHFCVLPVTLNAPRQITCDGASWLWKAKASSILLPC